MRIFSVPFRAPAFFRGVFPGCGLPIFLIIFLNFVSGVFEAVGINAIIPLFSFVGGQEHVPTDAVSRFIQNLFASTGIPYTATALLVVVASLFFLKALVSFCSRFMNLRIIARHEQETRLRLFRALLRSRWPYLKELRVGYADQVLLTDIGRSGGILFHIASLSVVLINIVIYGFLAVSVSPLIASAALIFGVCILLIFKPLFGAYRTLSGALVKKYKRLAHFLGEHLAGLKLIKASGVEEGVFSKSRVLVELSRALRVRSETIRIISEVILQPLGVFFIIGAFALLYKVGTVSFPSFAVIVYAINRVFVSVQQIQSEIHDINSRVPQALSVLHFERDARAHEETNERGVPFRFAETLSLRGISFSHGEAHLLRDITFSVKKGEMLGLIGESGSGKTTLVDLLLRLYTPGSGEILVDGVPADRVNLRSWRNSIGYVPQDPFLFHDTIENNIRWHGDALSGSDIEEMVRLAHASDFLAREKDGLQTLVGERGTRLSGGERQRIALARALARKPQVLILDEATSALDNESEALIQKSIEELRGKVTLIVIAHRLSTIAHADRLIVLERGRIAEEGSPAELLKQKGSYYGRVHKLS